MISISIQEKIVMAYKQDTICVQGGYRPQSGESRIPPIVQSTTFYYDSTQGWRICSI